MIKEVDKSGAIDLKSLEVGDKFLVFRGMPFLDDPFIYVTVLKLSEKKINAVDTDGKKYGFSRLSKTLQCFSENSKFVEKEKIAMKIRFFFRDLAYAGPESVDKKLLEDLESWKNRHKTKILSEMRKEGFERD